MNKINVYLEILNDGKNITRTRVRECVKYLLYTCLRMWTLSKSEKPNLSKSGFSMCVCVCCVIGRGGALGLNTSPQNEILEFEEGPMGGRV